MPDYLTNVVNDGPAWVLAGYMIWHLTKNYKGVCDRLNKVEDYIKEELTTVIHKSTEAMTQCKNKPQNEENKSDQN